MSLPGGAASELDVVMKLHKVEKHIRKNKLKVRTRCTCGSGPSVPLHACMQPGCCARIELRMRGIQCSAGIAERYGRQSTFRCRSGCGRVQVTLSGEIGASGGKELSSKAQARRLAFYLFWNIKADFTRNFIVQEDLEHFLPARKAARAFALLDTDLDGKVCRHRPRTPAPPARTCPPAPTLADPCFATMHLILRLCCAGHWKRSESGCQRLHGLPEG